MCVCVCVCVCVQFLYKIFWQNKMLYQPTIPIFFRAGLIYSLIEIWRLLERSQYFPAAFMKSEFSV